MTENQFASCAETKFKKFDLEENLDHLKWAHTMISKVKAFFAGTFHGLAPKHL